MKKKIIDTRFFIVDAFKIHMIKMAKIKRQLKLYLDIKNHQKEMKKVEKSYWTHYFSWF